jgi:hypothetical protein
MSLKKTPWKANWTNYEVKSFKKLLLNDEIEKKINIKKDTINDLNLSNLTRKTCDLGYKIEIIS